MIPIYQVKKITQKDVDNPRKRMVTATVEKVIELTGHLTPLITVFEVIYPVWNGKHMVNLVETLPQYKTLDNLERAGVADTLRDFN